MEMKGRGRYKEGGCRRWSKGEGAAAAFTLCRVGRGRRHVPFLSDGDGTPFFSDGRSERKAGACAQKLATGEDGRGKGKWAGEASARSGKNQRRSAGEHQIHRLDDPLPNASRHRVFRLDALEDAESRSETESSFFSLFLQ
jgi:hypothetical protein